MARDVDRSVLARSRKLMGMAAKVARHEVAQQVSARVSRSAERLGAQSLARRVEQARIVTESLSQLRGAAMKAGQFLSIDAGDLLPPEAAEMLAKLQDDGQSVPFETVEQVLREELGEAGLARLTDLSPEAAAAASIGQVHRARVDGRPVAVKVQFPGVKASIPSDLAVLQKLASSWLSLAGRRIVLADVFEELQRILELEADYRHEAACLHEYRRHLAEDARFALPEPIDALSGERVLTMTWLDGQPFGRWMGQGPSLEAREGVARALLDLYCQEFFEWGFVQTDPNPGNFMILDDGRVGLLDFGATVRYDHAFRRQYVELLRAMGRGRREELIETGIDFGLLDRREGAEAREAFVEMMQAAAHPFSPSVQPFEFQDPDYQRQARAIVFRFAGALRHTPPPRRLLFLHRKLGGLFNILKRLDVRLDMEPYWARMVGEARPSGISAIAS